MPSAATFLSRLLDRRQGSSHMLLSGHASTTGRGCATTPHEDVVAARRARIAVPVPVPVPVLSFTRIINIHTLYSREDRDIFKKCQTYFERNTRTNIISYYTAATNARYRAVTSIVCRDSCRRSRHRFSFSSRLALRRGCATTYNGVARVFAWMVLDGVLEHCPPR